MNELLSFIATLVDRDGLEVTSSTELIESGIIDSLNIVNLLGFVEQKTGRSVGLDDLDLDRIRTPEKIMKHYMSVEAV